MKLEKRKQIKNAILIIIGVYFFLVLVSLALPKPEPREVVVKEKETINVNYLESQMKDAFVGGCSSEDRAMRRFCECTFDKLMKKHSVELFLDSKYTADYVEREALMSGFECLHLLP